MKKPSDATLLRSARSENKELQQIRTELVRERDIYRARATKAEQEVAEWKRRFDALLERTPAPRRAGEGVGR